MLIGVAAVFVDPVMHALYGYTESLRDLGDFVTSISDLLYCFNLEIFGIAFCRYVQTSLDCVSVTLSSVSNIGGLPVLISPPSLTRNAVIINAPTT